MPNKQEFKAIARARLKTARILIKSNDFDGAAYMMGYCLEAALKTCICKKLNLIKYPDNTGTAKTDEFFKTHNFDRLLILSGLSNIFCLGNASYAKEFQNWSGFTSQYQGEWTDMRYSIGRFDKTKVIQMYTHLKDDNNSILNIIERKW